MWNGLRDFRVWPLEQGMQALRISVCLMAMALSVGMGFLWRSQFNAFNPNYPGVDVPVASNSSRSHSHSASVVSLSREGRWIHGEAGAVSEGELRSLLARKSSVMHGLGRTANIRVRIPKDAPARHFLAIHRIADECGFDRMIVSVTPRKALLRKG